MERWDRAMKNKGKKERKQDCRVITLKVREPPQSGQSGNTSFVPVGKGPPAVPRAVCLPLPAATDSSAFVTWVTNCVQDHFQNLRIYFWVIALRRKKKWLPNFSREQLFDFFFLRRRGERLGYLHRSLCFLKLSPLEPRAPPSPLWGFRWPVLKPGKFHSVMVRVEAF